MSDLIPDGWSKKQLLELISIKHGYAFEGEYYRRVPSKHILLTPGNFHRDGNLYFGAKTK
jgi:type I restriction enzyme S subunit